MQQAEPTPPIVVERYKYILQQIHTTNENVHRYFAVFQTLATAIAAAGVALFIGYGTWGISPSTARVGERGLLLLITLVAGFTILQIVVGILAWLDYRREECELTTRYLQADFRSMPRLSNFYRWYETYIVLFVAVATGVLWILGEAYIIPRIT